jgi:hypothetical protein
MPTEVTITLITTGGLVLVALIGVWIELIRSRKRQDSVVTAVTPNSGSSMRDVVGRIEATVDRMREAQVGQGERLARVEAKVENWVVPARRVTD